MVKSKEEIVALRKVKAERVKGALNNSLIELRKIGIKSAEAYADSKTGDGYLIFKLGDLVKLFERRTRRAVEKVAKNMVVKCYIELEVKRDENGNVVLDKNGKPIIDLDNSVFVIYLKK